MEHQRPQIELFGNAHIWLNFFVGEKKEIIWMVLKMDNTRIYIDSLYCA